MIFQKNIVSVGKMQNKVRSEDTETPINEQNSALGVYEMRWHRTRIEYEMVVYVGRD